MVICSFLRVLLHVYLFILASTPTCLVVHSCEHSYMFICSIMGALLHFYLFIPVTLPCLFCLFWHSIPSYLCVHPDVALLHMYLTIMVALLHIDLTNYWVEPFYAYHSTQRECVTIWNTCIINEMRYYIIESSEACFRTSSYLPYLYYLTRSISTCVDQYKMQYYVWQTCCANSPLTPLHVNRTADECALFINASIRDLVIHLQTCYHPQLLPDSLLWCLGMTTHKHWYLVKSADQY